MAAHGLVEPAGEDGPRDVAPLRPHLRGAVLLILRRGRRGWCAVGVCGRHDRPLRRGRDVLDQTDSRRSAQLRSARRRAELAPTTPRAAPMNPGGSSEVTTCFLFCMVYSHYAGGLCEIG